MLVAVVGATVVTGVFDLADEGVDTVGALPQGLPTPTFPSVPLDTLGALLAGRTRHRARVADRHDRHFDQLRRTQGR